MLLNASVGSLDLLEYAQVLFVGGRINNNNRKLLSKTGGFQASSTSGPDVSYFLQAWP